MDGLSGGSGSETDSFSPRPARAEDSEAGVGLWTGEAVAPAAEWGGGLEAILGVTTAGEPGPRSIRLSSVASVSICTITKQNISSWQRDYESVWGNQIKACLL